MGSCKREPGFTYLGLLLVIAIGGISMMVVTDWWQVVVQREKEKELIFIGHQYRDAIGRFYNSEISGGSYPQNLADLLQDPNSEEANRYIRRLYPDPVTGKNEWGLVRDDDGGIMGVFSLSADRPFKLTGFDKRDKCFTNKLRYSDWKFAYKSENSEDEDCELEN